MASADVVCKSEATTSANRPPEPLDKVVASELAVHVVGRSLLQRLCACARVGCNDDVRHGHLPFCRKITTGKCGGGFVRGAEPGHPLWSRRARAAVVPSPTPHLAGGCDRCIGCFGGKSRTVGTHRGRRAAAQTSDRGSHPAPSPPPKDGSWSPKRSASTLHSVLAARSRPDAPLEPQQDANREEAVTTWQ